VEERRGEDTLFNFTGLERALSFGDVDGSLLDDDLAPAFWGDRLTELALDHLGGEPGRDDIFVANRLTAAIVAAMQILVRPGDTVLGVSARYSHPVVVRAVRLAGGELVDTRGYEEFAAHLERDPALVVLTRLAVSYEALPLEELEEIVAETRRLGVRLFVDDAGGARVGPAVFGQPKTLELGADAGATGLDKYGTTGPRLGLLAGRADLVGRIRARGIELGLEARPMLYPAVVRSLERYSPERVRDLVAATNELGDALEARLPWGRANAGRGEARGRGRAGRGRAPGRRPSNRLLLGAVRGDRRARDAPAPRPRDPHGPLRRASARHVRAPAEVRTARDARALRRRRALRRCRGRSARRARDARDGRGGAAAPARGRARPHEPRPPPPGTRAARRDR
jgi:pyridoxal phosphate-dependent enzyme